MQRINKTEQKVIQSNYNNLFHLSQIQNKISTSDTKGNNYTTKIMIISKM
jgi:hypothetical protein